MVSRLANPKQAAATPCLAVAGKVSQSEKTESVFETANEFCFETNPFLWKRVQKERKTIGFPRNYTKRELRGLWELATMPDHHFHMHPPQTNSTNSPCQFRASHLVQLIFTNQSLFSHENASTILSQDFTHNCMIFPMTQEPIYRVLNQLKWEAKVQ